MWFARRDPLGPCREEPAATVRVLQGFAIAGIPTMFHATPHALFQNSGSIPHFIAVRRDEQGFGIRFGLNDAEDQLLQGPVFETLPEALAWIDQLDRLREASN